MGLLVVHLADHPAVELPSVLPLLLEYAYDPSYLRVPTSI